MGATLSSAEHMTPPPSTRFVFRTEFCLFMTFRKRRSGTAPTSQMYGRLSTSMSIIYGNPYLELLLCLFVFFVIVALFPEDRQGFSPRAGKSRP
ncbi:hypothetical protein BDZ94DRAFT_1271529 [Collybia nuda]|uniref:Uncharacterized protein n=1 Tax=Collybia nuda TaxID=64659 RepID=A0A9P6CEM8_9AGAR|nr:hypothetical protein BDZ94DRAFT_1271529 [Collybia nuda]